MSNGEPVEPAGEVRLPIPPLRLRRIRLHGVGPDGARFDPLDLDFTTQGGAASRVLLSLTNTGGKSTLITLVSSLIVPAARAQVGRKVLGDYLLTGDTAHIVCEWEDTTVETRTVTGTVMEWKDGRRQPAEQQRSTTNMHRAWYLFRTGNDLPGIDDLPFVADGRRSTFERFKASVDDLFDAHPAAQGFVTRIQQEWTRQLQDRTSIDPVLFSYQMRMNDSESGAEKLLATFDSPDNVVRFFVAALNQERDLSDFTNKLSAYATLAAQRPQLTDLAEFGNQVGPLVTAVAKRAADTKAADDKVWSAQIAGADYAAALANRIDEDRSILADLDETLQAAAAEVIDLRKQYGRISDIRLQLILDQARSRLIVAEEAVERRKQESEEADFIADAWEIVDRVIDLDEARSQRDTAKLAYDAADAGLGPLRSAFRSAAKALAVRLDALAIEADKAIVDAKARIEELEAEENAALERQNTARKQLQSLERDLTDDEKLVTAATTAVEQAIVDGWLEDNESPEDAIDRWSNTQLDCEAKATDAGERSQTAETAAAELEQRRAVLDEVVASQLVAAENALGRRDNYMGEIAALDTDGTVAEIGGMVPAEADDAARAADIVARYARDADNRAQKNEKLAGDAQAELTHLDETGTTPSGPDVLAVLSVLLDSNIGAATGLSQIERNVPEPEQRPHVIAAQPDVAGGVIVSDPARFAEACTLLDAMDLRTRVPVVVTTVMPNAQPADDRPTGGRYVVLPDRATWDRQWAAESRSRLEDIAATANADATKARTTAEKCRKAAAACAGFADRWQGCTRSDLVHVADQAAKALETTRTEQIELDQARDAHLAEVKAARTAWEQAIRGAADAEKSHREALRLRDMVTAAAEANHRRASLLEDRAQYQNQIAAAETIRTEAKAETRVQIARAEQARGTAVSCRKERNDIGVDETGPDIGGNLDVLRTTWSTQRSELASAEAGLPEADLLKRAEQTLTRAKNRLSGHDKARVDAARELAMSLEAASDLSRRDAQIRAKDIAKRLHRALLGAEQEVETAAAEMQRATPPSPDRLNHIDLAGTPEWQPENPDQIETLLKRLDEHGDDVRTQRDRAEKAQAEAQERHSAVADDINSLADTLRLWRKSPSASINVFRGTREAAREEMAKHLDTLHDAEVAAQSALDDLRAAVTAARALATDVRWRDLKAPSAVRLRSLAEADLIDESAGLANRIATMTKSAAGDLEGLDVHRSILRDGLLVLCRDQRRLLRELSRASRLPDGLGNLSGQSAIKIRFDEAPDDEAAARLADRIDTWAIELAANPKRVDSSDTRTRWLTDAVRDTVINRPRAGPWSIEILKPRIDGQVVHCAPDRIPHEFSGGQVLTLAVLVYCALSGVRSAHRPGSARPAGCLILDNPFGAASAETLIEMQHKLAAHTGLQLVCATGLHDAGVDAAFTGPSSVIVKLRNDGDARRNLSFLRLRTTIVDGIDIPLALTSGRDRTSQQNWVEATTYRVEP